MNARQLTLGLISAAIVAGVCLDSAQAVKTDLKVKSVTVHASMYPIGPWLALTAKIYLDPNAAGNTNNEDWGSGTAWVPGAPDPSPVTPCGGPELPCSTYNIGAWSTDVTFGGVAYTVTEAHNNHYWDQRYVNYVASGSCDYAKNCHGYVMGDNYWLSGAVSPSPMVGWANACDYDPATNNNERLQATVAVRNDWGHSLKLTVDNCGGTAQLVGTSEQFRESGTYSQSGSCAQTVEITTALANSNYDESDFMWLYHNPN